MTKIALIYDTRHLADVLSIAFREKPDFELILHSQGVESLLKSGPALIQPDLILLSISTDDGKHLLSSLPEIKTIFPGTKVMVAAAGSAPNLILEAICKGADSYGTLDENLQDLWNAIGLTLSGGVYLDPFAAPVLLDHLKQISPWKSSPGQSSIEAWQRSGKFVARELQVIQGLMNNQSYKEIAHNNNIGLNTVRHYVKSVYKKLDINSRSQLREVVIQS